MATGNFPFPNRQADFLYDIFLNNPDAALTLKKTQNGHSRGGFSPYIPRKWHAKFGEYRKFTDAELYRHRIRHALFKDELSMSVDKKSITDLVFKISGATKWSFAKIPFTFDPADVVGDVVGWKRVSDSMAVIRVVGGKLVSSPAKLDYTLHFLDDAQKPQDHDPRIKNDLAEPFTKLFGHDEDAGGAYILEPEAKLKSLLHTLEDLLGDL